jgi:hypothetical protein
MFSYAEVGVPSNMVIQFVYFSQLPTLNMKETCSAKAKLFHLYEQSKYNIFSFIT